MIALGFDPAEWRGQGGAGRFLRDAALACLMVGGAAVTYAEAARALLALAARIAGAS